MAIGFGLKLMPNGRKVWILHLAYPGHQHQTNRLIGEYPEMSLSDAREKATKWYRMVRQGLDPAVEERKEQEAKARRDALAQSTTFASVVEAYATRMLAKQRQGAAVLRRLEVEVVPTLGARPIAEISQGEITAVLETIMDRTETGARARNVLADIKGVFGYALDRPDTYGMTSSIVDRIKPKRLFGKKVPKEQIDSTCCGGCCSFEHFVIDLRTRMHWRHRR